MAAIPSIGGGDFPHFNEQESRAASLQHPQPRNTMNSTQSHPQPFPQPDEELRIRDYAVATVLIVGACASIAIGFAAIATCCAADAAIKRVFRRGGEHAS